MSPNRTFSRGQILISGLFAVILLCGFAGLAVDVVYAYLVRAALVTAVDASALAGIRAVPDGISSATTAVDRTFNGNFPPGFLGSISSSYSGPTITEDEGGRKLVFSGAATLPTLFMRLFGLNTLSVGATATTYRRDLNLILVLDYSYSLVHELPEVKSSAQYFVNHFDDSRDQVGLVTFSTASRLDYPPKTQFKNDINNQINSIQTLWSTNSSQGLWLAYKGLNDLVDPKKANKLNAIVFFTDGNATTMDGQFPVRTSGNPHCTSSPQDGALSGVGGTTGGGGAGPYGVINRNATAQPVTTEPMVPGCAGVNPNQAAQLITSIPAIWYPAYPATSPAISILGPNSASTTSITGNNIQNIAVNMEINMAEVIREDPLRIMISTIGLGDMDQAVLRRVANDLSSSFYNSSQATGVFAYASDTTQLKAAFQRVASSIDRLIQ